MSLGSAELAPYLISTVILTLSVQHNKLASVFVVIAACAVRIHSAREGRNCAGGCNVGLLAS
jgi:hypothetical protein